MRYNENIVTTVSAMQFSNQLHVNKPGYNTYGMTNKFHCLYYVTGI